jgi:type IV pilus assembly protein PilB
VRPGETPHLFMADRIGELLVRENLISLAQLKRAQADQRTTGKRLSYSLSRLGILGERELADFCRRSTACRG